MLNAEGIYKSYGQVEVLKGVSISLQKGEVVALVGSSGAGKSTLLQLLGTLDHADQGNIWFEGKVLGKLSESQLAKFRNESLGFVFQFHHLLPEFTALENVCIPGWIHGFPKGEVEERAAGLLKRLGLGDRLQHKPSQLSGGEQQRVSVARALINRPKLVLADEPTGNLDTKNSDELYKILFDLTRENEVAFLVATHDMDLAQKADRILQIKDGVINA